VKPAQDTFWGGYGGYFQDPTSICGKLCGIPPVGSQGLRHNITFRQSAPKILPECPAN